MMKIWEKLEGKSSYHFPNSWWVRGRIVQNTCILKKLGRAHEDQIKPRTSELSDSETLEQFNVGLTFSSHLHPRRPPPLLLPPGVLATTGELGAGLRHQLDIDQLEAVKRSKGVKRPLPTDGRIRLLKQLHLKILERRSDENLRTFRNVLAMKTSSKNGRIRLLWWEELFRYI